jgi:ribosomal protein L22
MEARIKSSGIPISTLDAVNIARFIRGKELAKARAMLVLIEKQKESLPHIKYKGSSGHRKGDVMAGSYPVKAVREVIKLLDGVEANARNRSMVPPFVISHIKADSSGLQWHYGRQRRIRRKNTRIEITLVEMQGKEGKKRRAGEEKNQAGNVQETTKEKKEMKKEAGKEEKRKAVARTGEGKK